MRFSWISNRPVIQSFSNETVRKMVKKLKLDIYYLSTSVRGFAQIIGTDVLCWPGGLKSKTAAAFLLFKVCPTSIF